MHLRLERALERAQHARRVAPERARPAANSRRRDGRGPGRGAGAMSANHRNPSARLADDLADAAGLAGNLW